MVRNRTGKIAPDATRGPVAAMPSVFAPTDANRRRREIRSGYASRRLGQISANPQVAVSGGGTGEREEKVLGRNQQSCEGQPRASACPHLRRAAAHSITALICSIFQQATGAF